MQTFGLGSAAEDIYQTWNTAAARQSLADVRARREGFVILRTRLAEYAAKHTSTEVAEQAWKLLDKFCRRHGELIASDVNAVLEQDARLAAALQGHPSRSSAGLSEQVHRFATIVWVNDST